MSTGSNVTSSFMTSDPAEMSENEIRAFISDLASKKRGSRIDADSNPSALLSSLPQRAETASANHEGIERPKEGIDSGAAANVASVKSCDAAISYDLESRNPVEEHDRCSGTKLATVFG